VEAGVRDQPAVQPVPDGDRLRPGHIRPDGADLTDTDLFTLFSWI
jgi:hypothetical protein